MNDDEKRALGHASTERATRAADGCVAFGWLWLATSACAGLALEVLHGLKVAAFLDVEGVRTMLRLAHAHGVGLSLVLIAFGVTAAPRLGARTSSTAITLVAGVVLVPVGFALGAIGHGEVDPGLGVWLVPLGALGAIVALARTAIAAIGHARNHRR